jgi:hypothetical protein
LNQPRQCQLCRTVISLVKVARCFGFGLSSMARKEAWLEAVVSSDPCDPKLAHLDRLNLSRARMLEGIAAGLPKGDKAFR